MLDVFLTTYDGAETLPDVLDGYRRVAAPRGGWRLVAVDDGSRDASPDLLAAAAKDLPITLLRFPHRGLNAARNAGLAAVEGDLIVFTDDDAVPRPDCLVRLREAADAHPEATVFAGTVLPSWRAAPPAWVLEWVRLAPTYALCEPADGPVAPDLPVGPCVAIRRAAFADGTRFDEARGPDGTEDYAMGGETELLLRLAARGHRTLGVPSAVVEHVVLPHQVTEAWILGRAERLGRGRARRPGGAPGRWRHAGQVFRARMRLALSFWTRDRRRRFKARWRLRFLAGLARERRAGRAPR